MKKKLICDGQKAICVIIFSFRAAKPYTYDIHILKCVRPLYLGASCTKAYYCYISSIKLITYAVFSSYVPFLHHYMHRYDLSFG